MIDKMKGLVVIHDPHSLLQFVWYYEAYGKSLDWTALCLPNNKKKEYMSEYCNRAEIFESVIKSNRGSYETMGFLSRVRVFVQMFGYYILGRRKDYCRKVLNEYVKDITIYNQIGMITGGGIVTGACVGISEDANVFIMDDGAGEYCCERKWSNIYKKKFSLTSFLLTVMGYCGVNRLYPYKQLKNCTKFLIRPELYKGNEYKKVLKMQDDNILPLDKCKEIYSRIYSKPDEKMLAKVQAIFFLGDYSYWTSKNDYYLQKLYDYIDTFEEVAIKLHPSDNLIFNFRHVKVHIITQSLPGEIVIPYIRNKPIYFTYNSSLMMRLEEYQVFILLFKTLENNLDCDKCSFWNDLSDKYLMDFVPNIQKVYL